MGVYNETIKKNYNGAPHVYWRDDVICFSRFRSYYRKSFILVVGVQTKGCLSKSHSTWNIFLDNHNFPTHLLRSIAPCMIHRVCFNNLKVFILLTMCRVEVSYCERHDVNIIVVLIKTELLN